MRIIVHTGKARNRWQKARQEAAPRPQRSATGGQADHGGLEEGREGVFESGRYRRYLAVMSRFHGYSANNRLLIAMQRPDATLVAGYRAWQDKFGRQVRKGERGMKHPQPSRGQGESGGRRHRRSA